MADPAYDTLLSLILLILRNGTNEILVNPGFEQPLGSDWSCLGCTGRVVSDAHTGNRSFLATNRYQQSQGPYQTIQEGSRIISHQIYRFSGFVKILQSFANQEPQSINVIIIYDVSPTSVEWTYIFRIIDLKPTDGWIYIEGEFYTWEINQRDVLFSIRGPDPGVDFQIDTMSVVHVGKATPESRNVTLRNPGFENPIGGSGWYCLGHCGGVLVNDSHTGKQAYKAFNRTESRYGPVQMIQPSSGITAGHIYHFSGYVKLLPSLGTPELQTVHVYMYYLMPDSTWEDVYVAHAHDIASVDGWVQIETEFYTLDVNQERMDLGISDPDPGVDFLVDSLSIVKIGEALPEPSDQILRNSGFENPIGGSGWFCQGRCTEALVNDSHSGSNAYKASDRSSSINGPAQMLTVGSRVSKGSKYQFAGYVKIIQSLPSQLPQSVGATLVYSRFGFGFNERSVGIAYAFRVTPEDGWVALEGEFEIPDDADTAVIFLVDGPESGVDFLVDTLSITEII